MNLCIQLYLSSYSLNFPPICINFISNSFTYFYNKAICTISSPTILPLASGDLTLPVALGVIWPGEDILWNPLWLIASVEQKFLILFIYSCIFNSFICLSCSWLTVFSRLFYYCRVRMRLNSWVGLGGTMGRCCSSSDEEEWWLLKLFYLLH